MSTAPRSDGEIVAGVDGCPGGWIAVVRRVDDPQSARIDAFRTFLDVLASGPFAMVAVDIPIGLPERARLGGRAADVEARKVLGARQSSVFSVPSRAAVVETDYRFACEIALATSDPPRKISKQAFNLFPKIREVDALMTPELQRRVREVHPEVAFSALNGWKPLGLPKKVKSRPFEPGLEMRRELLAGAGYSAQILNADVRPVGAGPDDLLDAAANSWTAVRLALGAARCFPVEPEIDARGLKCEIWG